MLRVLARRAVQPSKSTFCYPLLRPPCRLAHQRPYLVPVRAFHSTPANNVPIFPILASVFKASTALEVARTLGRIVLSVVPIILLKNAKSRHVLKHNPDATEESKTGILNKIRNRTRLFQLLISIPSLLVLATIIASLERTPLTGRWRLIILSPEEEEEIASQLVGPGWYNAVSQILADDGSTRIIAPTDWRYIWVLDTLRRLEASVPVLVQESLLCPEWPSSCDRPMPPPATFPLRPRPRASEQLKTFCENLMHRVVPPAPHNVLGPPYSLLVVDKPESANAFSYGFGPNGGGGVVVYSGFLDDIFLRYPPVFPTAEPSWLSTIFGGLFDSQPQHPIPTQEQTSQLAILLAHELSHLVLSHHLETLSSGTVFIPGFLSIIADVVRVLIFPFTMMFGPFVNDAVAQLGKVGSGELMKISDYCTSIHQEIEADIVSARLLAHAGFDARDAVAFWETRSFLPKDHTDHKDCVHAEGIQSKSPKAEGFVHRIMGSSRSHPINERRVESLKQELKRWEMERRAVLRRQQSPPQPSSIHLATA